MSRFSGRLTYRRSDLIGMADGLRGHCCEVVILDTGSWATEKKKYFRDGGP
jgi:hypothetical protein